MESRQEVNSHRAIARHGAASGNQCMRLFRPIDPVLASAICAETPLARPLAVSSSSSSFSSACAESPNEGEGDEKAASPTLQLSFASTSSTTSLHALSRVNIATPPSSVANGQPVPKALATPSARSVDRPRPQGSLLSFANHGSPPVYTHASQTPATSSFGSSSALLGRRRTTGSVLAAIPSSSTGSLDRRPTVSSSSPAAYLASGPGRLSYSAQPRHHMNDSPASPVEARSPSSTSAPASSNRRMSLSRRNSLFRTRTQHGATPVRVNTDTPTKWQKKRGLGKPVDIDHASVVIEEPRLGMSSLLSRFSLDDSRPDRFGAGSGGSLLRRQRSSPVVERRPSLMRRMLWRKGSSGGKGKVVVLASKAPGGFDVDADSNLVSCTDAEIASGTKKGALLSDVLPAAGRKTVCSVSKSSHRSSPSRGVGRWVGANRGACAEASSTTGRDFGEFQGKEGEYCGDVVNLPLPASVRSADDKSLCSRAAFSSRRMSLDNTRGLITFDVSTASMVTRSASSSSASGSLFDMEGSHRLDRSFVERRPPVCSCTRRRV